MDNFEKKYNEALERAKELIAKWTGKNKDFYTEDYAYIFPELRESESEDEKNANALISLLNDERVSVLMTYEARQQWLDWLERKKTPSVSFNPALGFDSGSAVVYHNEDSEDERIRKWLTDLFSNRNEKFVQELDNYRGLVTREQILAYLEKQKNLMPPTHVDPCDASWYAYYQRGLNKGYELGLEAGRKEQKPISQEDFDTAKDEALWGEQKPVESIEDSVKFEEGFKVGRESGLRDGQKYVLNNLDSYGLCMPAWSEEDEKMRDRIIDILNRTFSVYSALGTSSTRPSCPTYKDEIAWLKSLRPQWKPSEDEERLINTSISFLKDFADKGYENAVECIDWLKSKLNGNSGK